MPTTLTLRRSPYTGPTGRSGALNIAFTIPSIILAIAALPISTIRYLFTRPKGFSLKIFLIFRLLRFLNLLVPILPPPEKRKALWEGPKTAGTLPEVKIETVKVAPAPEAWRVGYAAGPNVVKAIEMPGYIITPAGIASGPARDGEKIIMYIHGGAYVRGHPLWTAFPHRLAAETGRRVYGVQYRKTLDDATAFPGPLLDALAAWAYVTKEMGFRASQIILSGDSAGAHLSLMLVRQLQALGEALPGGLAFASPWVDFTCSFPCWNKHTLDYITITKLRKCIDSATRHYADEVKQGAFFSPVNAEAGHWRFLINTPVFVSYGGLEVFMDEDEALVAAMREDGVHVTVWKDEYGVHDTPIFDCVIPTKSKAFTHFKDGVLDLLRIEAADAEVVPASPKTSESSSVLVEAEANREGEVDDHDDDHTEVGFDVDVEDKEA
ncbi:hypothetical protein CcaverHIS002_0604540 [Cutaneotrichosporon cavernicola]|uniref:Alpha/beta hydrolase fold-3 domain-containing protein n=1 Tax=Cutaneotrichosporon cavernicola TaxID=279322 RepID=A0AA48L8M3_9TREE|nr:uncharacterized protein CcaverHIS019_0603990 [Cutaneotrichosporon cavernicola]BEI86167.1 hypothetical protein CcaverHIS002_0604540 [Cutaneotrichosporon cavernicola]BEI93940.1 hypothetical protein CcaverHIS019_0603990 [Cutaneotrichosporon cavernicola]BEJ01720.1 hypothetical protein CcaverHIS631_0604020 [Cutaneotrichosporon cavernicola]BEJ09487.1 hypothetical protein CcaverHIS641_0604020 [Cutaneotrichosporon cavernicola]